MFSLATVVQILLSLFIKYLDWVDTPWSQSPQATENITIILDLPSTWVSIIQLLKCY